MTINTEKTPSRLDQLTDRVKDHRLLAAALFVGVAIIGTGSVLSSLDSSVSLIDKWLLGRKDKAPGEDEHILVSNEEVSLPRVGSFVAKSNSMAGIKVRADTWFPVNLIIDVPRAEPRHYDYSMTFDVTNTDQMDLRIINFFFRTKDWQPLPVIRDYNAAGGIGEIKRYFCMIDSELADYPCNFEKQDQFVVLSPGELEVFQVSINTNTEGIYAGELYLEYSVGGSVAKLAVGAVEDLYFAEIETVSGAGDRNR